MIEDLSEFLNFSVSLNRSVDGKQEWKDISKSNRSVFVKLNSIRDRHWLSRHKALYFEGKLLEWVDRASDRSFSGHETYAYCLPLFLAWYFHENGAGLLDAIRESMLKRNRTLDQVKKGRMLIDKANRPVYHGRPYGMFGPATPGIVDLFFEGELSDRYEGSVEYGDYVAQSDRAAVRMYFGALRSIFYGSTEGAEWLPGRFRRARAMQVSHKANMYMDENIVSSIYFLKETWEAFLKGRRDYTGAPMHLMSLMNETDRQLREDIQSGALSGWVADILVDGIDI